jgi:hypothetical protein
MNKRRGQALTPRVIYYPEPTHRTDVRLYSPQQLAARRRHEAQQYARWAEQQLAIAEHDRRVRRFWLGFGAIAGAGTLAGCAGVGWWIYQAITASLGLLAIPIGLLIIAGLAVGGHRCVTVIQHRH